MRVWDAAFGGHRMMGRDAALGGPKDKVPGGAVAAHPRGKLVMRAVPSLMVRRPKVPSRTMAAVFCIFKGSHAQLFEAGYDPGADGHGGC
jgi:hypothetical protein